MMCGLEKNGKLHITFFEVQISSSNTNEFKGWNSHKCTHVHAHIHKSEKETSNH